MNSSRIIILSVAVLSAIGAGYVAKQMMATPPAPEVVQGPQEPAIELTEVLVVRKDVPMGSALTGSIGWQSWPKDGVDEKFITRQSDTQALEELSGSIARVPLYAGEPLRRSKLIGEGQSFMSSILPAGKRAVATQIAADTSAGGFILPNDYVDVIMTRRAAASGNQPASGPGFITETILKNIRILAIDQAIQEDEEGRKVRVGDTATLELTPEQAEIITVAQQMAEKLTLALRPVADALEPVESGGEYLVSGNGRRGTVRMIRNGEVTEVGSR